MVKHEPASPIEVASCFTILGTVPKPNYSIVLASSYDPYAVAIAIHPIQTVLPRNHNASSYVKKQYCQTCFLLNPIGLWLQISKNLLRIIFLWTFIGFLKILVKTWSITLLFHEKSIFIKPITYKFDASKIIFYSVFILNITNKVTI